MRLYTMITPRYIAKLLAASVFAFSTATAATVTTDITLAEGPGDVIAPDRTPTLTGSGSTAQSTLEARSDLFVLQNFTGIASKTTAIFAFTDETKPDVQIRLASDPANFWSSTSTENTTNDSFASSYGSAYIIQTPTTEASAISYALAIDFGSYNSSTEEFTTGTGVYASAFTLNSAKGRLELTDSIVVEFKSTSGSTLSTQTILGTDIINDASSNPGMYFGYETTGDLIGSVEITINRDAGTLASSMMVGLDDITFTSIPEPSTSAALLGAAVLVGMLIRRRRR
ncbi:PEP-CTERM sorting domain-containing protein [Ruficoccus sp. ZRK36]|uniref:PEP-CTERM sorting domain-containing protein n=1 Tax=Ruficoccus sp. ZRK36 TaxID=2866311 RepID=UPI001C735651|nr:PEP-CTERM sorting domain-containing protein [Ruficoccus sp. ZRK36]QYY34519.1 PEP-CTERM sorting domain-containing protein [Ruficoccus sp. ZRK36]